MNCNGKLAGFVAVAAATGFFVVGRAQERQPSPAAAPSAKGELPDLAAALWATPGCLGVELAWTHRRKERHLCVVRGQEGGPALVLQRGAPADHGPADAPKFQGMTLSISQIAIELYKPINGGVFLGGRFAPESLKVEAMLDYARARSQPAPPPQ